MYHIQINNDRQNPQWENTLRLTIIIQDSHDWLLDRFLLFACLKFHAQTLLLEKQQLVGASLDAESCMGVLLRGTPVPAETAQHLRRLKRWFVPSILKKPWLQHLNGELPGHESAVGEGMWSARGCQVCFARTMQIQPLWLKVSAVQEIKYM